MRRDENWGSSADMAIFDWPFETDEIESAADTVLWWNEIKELNEGEFFTVSVGEMEE